jgi:GAF domain-containing protein
VRQALETGGPVVAANAPEDPRLGKRPSVVAHGIGSLACVPLRHDKILGVIYVDSRKVGPAFTELDLETLEALADHAANVLAASRSEAAPPRVLGAVERDLVARLQQRIEELLPAV